MYFLIQMRNGVGCNTFQIGLQVCPTMARVINIALDTLKTYINLIKEFILFFSSYLLLLNQDMWHRVSHRRTTTAVDSAMHQHHPWDFSMPFRRFDS